MVQLRVGCMFKPQKMGRWPKMGVMVVKKSGGDGHCGRHTHSNSVKEVSRVKKQKQKTYMS